MTYSRYILLLFIGLLMACGGADRVGRRTMDRAEALLNSRPDSALALLRTVSPDSLGRAAAARHSLLFSMAVDKNYIDTTDMSILQSAISYYADHGTPDDRLRTLYYQGRIYQNRDDYDSAMTAFIRARQYIPLATDSLTVANLLVAHAAVYYRIYDIESYVESNLEANRIYHAMGHLPYEFSGLEKLLIAGCISKDTVLADSLVAVATSIVSEHPEYRERLETAMIPYELQLGSDSVVRDVLDNKLDKVHIEPVNWLDVASGLRRTGEYRKGLEIIRQLEDNNLITDTDKYYVAKVRLLEAVGDYEGAVKLHNKIHLLNDKTLFKLFSRDMLTAQQRFNAETQKQNALQAETKSRFILITLIVVLFSAGCIIGALSAWEKYAEKTWSSYMPMK